MRSSTLLLLTLALLLLLFCPLAPADVASVIFADGFEAFSPGPAPGVTPGTGSGLLLRGMVVTPVVAFAGEVLVEGDTITCAAASCADQPGASTASIVETKGLIFPGLINTHDITLFGMFDENDWSPAQRYANHSEWANDARYKALVDAKQYLNGEGGSPVQDGCEMEKYGELKGLVTGTTSIVSAANPANLVCYGSLARTIDQTPNDLGADYVQVSLALPSQSSADQVCANFAGNSTHAYLVNVAEGVNTAARDEFATLGTVTTTDACLYAPGTAIVRGTALGDTELALMGQNGMSLVWSPHSDVTLYGSTADVPLALSKDVNVSLASGWSITGGHNLLAELRYADQVDNTSWGDVLTAYDLVQMVTTGAAHMLHLEDQIGSIEAGKKADLTVIAGSCDAPWSALVNARSADVRLVMVGGVPLYGDATLQSIAPSSPGCESTQVCGNSRFLCVAESGGTPSNKLGQTLSDIVGILTPALAAYDALDLSQWNFSPIAPLVDCP